MIRPIVAFGDQVLKKVAKEIPQDYPKLKELIHDMFETMYNARGIGLAAPQLGLPIRIFVVDSEQVLQDNDNKQFVGEKGIKHVFINAKVIETGGKPWAYNEGCLSIPTINEDVVRDETVRIQFYDHEFNFYDHTFSGLTARIILHEYDHIEGILFTDHISSLRKRLLRRKLQNVSKGKVEVNYRMKYPNLKRR